MTNQYTTVKIQKHFDADGKPSCDGCELSVFRGSKASCTHLWSSWEERLYEGSPYNQQVPGTDCPPHNELKEPL